MPDLPFALVPRDLIDLPDFGREDFGSSGAFPETGLSSATPSWAVAFALALACTTEGGFGFSACSSYSCRCALSSPSASSSRGVGTPKVAMFFCYISRLAMILSRSDRICWSLLTTGLGGCISEAARYICPSLWGATFAAAVCIFGASSGLSPIRACLPVLGAAGVFRFLFQEDYVLPSPCSCLFRASSFSFWSVTLAVFVTFLMSSSISAISCSLRDLADCNPSSSSPLWLRPIWVGITLYSATVGGWLTLASTRERASNVTGSLCL